VFVLLLIHLTISVGITITEHSPGCLYCLTQKSQRKHHIYDKVLVLANIYERAFHNPPEQKLKAGHKTPQKGSLPQVQATGNPIFS
jgi:hypothetical protein